MVHYMVKDEMVAWTEKVVKEAKGESVDEEIFATNDEGCPIDLMPINPDDIANWRSKMGF